MEDWTYKELKDTIYEDIEDFKNDNYLDSKIAGRCFYEYTTVISDGYTESVIVSTIIGKYVIEKCLVDTVKFHSDNIFEVLKNYDRKKLDGSLTEQEIQELESNIEFVLKGIEERLK